MKLLRKLQSFFVGDADSIRISLLHYFKYDQSVTSEIFDEECFCKLGREFKIYLSWLYKNSYIVLDVDTKDNSKNKITFSCIKSIKDQLNGKSDYIKSLKLFKGEVVLMIRSNNQKNTEDYLVYNTKDEIISLIAKTGSKTSREAYAFFSNIDLFNLFLNGNI